MSKTPTQFDYQNYDYLDSLEGVPQSQAAKVNLLSLGYLRSLAPGLSAALMIALAALFLAQHYLAPAVFFALLLGLAVNFLAGVDATRAGLDFAAKNILRIGIAISGARLTFQEIAALGCPVVSPLSRSLFSPALCWPAPCGCRASLAFWAVALWPFAAPLRRLPYHRFCRKAAVWKCTPYSSLCALPACRPLR